MRLSALEKGDYDMDNNEQSVPDSNGIDWFSPLTRAMIRKVNALHRQNDDSQSWPICGEFNVAKRAIRRLRRQGHGCDCPYSYDQTLSAVESEIVNSSF